MTLRQVGRIYDVLSKSLIFGYRMASTRTCRARRSFSQPLGADAPERPFALPICEVRRQNSALLEAQQNAEPDMTEQAAAVHLTFVFGLDTEKEAPNYLLAYGVANQNGPAARPHKVWREYAMLVAVAAKIHQRWTAETASRADARFSSYVAQDARVSDLPTTLGGVIRHRRGVVLL